MDKLLIVVSVVCCLTASAFGQSHECQTPITLSNLNITLRSDTVVNANGAFEGSVVRVVYKMENGEFTVGGMNLEFQNVKAIHSYFLIRSEDGILVGQGVTYPISDTSKTITWDNVPAGPMKKLIVIAKSKKKSENAIMKVVSLNGCQARPEADMVDTSPS